jgi:hypothetical protein
MLASHNCEMETEPRKSKLRKRHEFGHGGPLNGIGGANFCAGNFKSVHGIPFSRDEHVQQMSLLVADSQFPSASPQGPDPSAGGFGAGSGRRSGGSSRHGGHFGAADVPNGPMWSHLTAAQYPSAPTGLPVVDDFGVVFADEVAIPAIVELDPREDEVLRLCR